MTPDTGDLAERIAAAETDLFYAETYKQRTAAADRLDALNAQKLTLAVSERDRQALASHRNGPLAGGIAGLTAEASSTFINDPSSRA
jgi:hypothetical protein